MSEGPGRAEVVVVGIEVIGIEVVGIEVGVVTGAALGRHCE